MFSHRDGVKGPFGQITTFNLTLASSRIPKPHWEERGQMWRPVFGIFTRSSGLFWQMCITWFQRLHSTPCTNTLISVCCVPAFLLLLFVFLRFEIVKKCWNGPDFKRHFPFSIDYFVARSANYDCKKKLKSLNWKKHLIQKSSRVDSGYMWQKWHAFLRIGNAFRGFTPRAVSTRMKGFGGTKRRAKLSP